MGVTCKKQQAYRPHEAIFGAIALLGRKSVWLGCGEKHHIPGKYPAFGTVIAGLVHLHPTMTIALEHKAYKEISND
jgi:hypothetical protein